VEIIHLAINVKVVTAAKTVINHVRTTVQYVQEMDKNVNMLLVRETLTNMVHVVNAGLISANNKIGLSFVPNVKVTGTQVNVVVVHVHKTVMVPVITRPVSVLVDVKRATMATRAILDVVSIVRAEL